MRARADCAVVSVRTERSPVGAFEPIVIVATRTGGRLHGDRIRRDPGPKLTVVAAGDELHVRRALECGRSPCDPRGADTIAGSEIAMISTDAPSLISPSFR
jgi:hypothetical protein